MSHMFTLLHASAVSLYADGRHAEALRVVAEGLTADPEDGRLWEVKGLAHRAWGEADQAWAALETASLYVPLTPVARWALAACYAQAGRRKLAGDLYTALAEDPRTPAELWLPIAEGLDAVGESARALALCREAARQDPDSSRAWHDLAGYLGRCGYPNRLVLAAARKAVALSPEVGRWRIGLASRLSQAGRNQEALAVAERLTNGQLAEAHCACSVRRIAELFEAAGEFARSQICHDRAETLEAES